MRTPPPAPPAPPAFVPPDLSVFEGLDDGETTAIEPGVNPADALGPFLNLFSSAPPVAPEELKERVERIGGLKLLRDVPMTILSRDELAAYVRRLFAEDYPPARARRDECILRAFGLLPPGLRLRPLRERILNENVAGFYDERPEVRKLFAVSQSRDLDLLNQFVMAHELRHAIQDQHYNLRPLFAGRSEYDDRSLALLSLIEGDAVLVMNNYLLQTMMPEMAELDAGAAASGARDDPDMAAALAAAGEAEMAEEEPAPVDGSSLLVGEHLRTAPAVVREQLVEPYALGQRLAMAIHARGGFSELAASFRRPPASMEQVLHPEKYLAGTDTPVELSAPPLPGATLMVEGRLGELLMRVMLEEIMDRSLAARIAAGWGGDAYAVWRDASGKLRLDWRTAWDTEQDAREFEGAMLLLVRDRWNAINPGGNTVTRKGDRVTVTREGLAWP